MMTGGERSPHWKPPFGLGGCISNYLKTFNQPRAYLSMDREGRPILELFA
ncbi:hypothetical protein Hanom_Chr14g01297841 [Helianthus anomalus]